jgi:uncharacterized protein (DUF1697 family)
MARLRALAGAAGLGEAETYVASGNLVFEADAAPEALERLLEEAIRTEFGFDVDVLVRSAAQWRALIEANPFPERGAEAPSKLMVTLGRNAPAEAGVEALRVRATGDEALAISGGALWIWFGDGAGRSKLAAAPSKGVWTTRNWRTAVAIGEMLG